MPHASFDTLCRSESKIPSRYLPTEIILTIASYLENKYLEEFELSSGKIYNSIKNYRQFLYKLKFENENSELYKLIKNESINWIKLYKEIKSLKKRRILQLDDGFFGLAIRRKLNYILDVFLTENILGKKNYKDLLFGYNYLGQILSNNPEYFIKLYHKYDQYENTKEYDKMMKLYFSYNRLSYEIGLIGNLDIIKTLHSNKYIKLDDSILKGYVMVSPRSRDKGVIEWVLKNINVDQKTLYDVFYYTVKMKDLKIAKLLLQNPNVDPTFNNNFAMVWAVSAADVEMVKLLLDDGRINPSYDNNYLLDLINSVRDESNRERYDKIEKMIAGRDQRSRARQSPQACMRP